MSGVLADISLAERYASVLARVEQAAVSAGRDPSDVTVIGVTKTVDRVAVDQAYSLGMRVFGENRVQDAKAKFSEPLPPDAQLHMIGSLQSNKAKTAIELFDVIQSVDRLSLVDALAKHAVDSGSSIDVLIEVNVAGEVQKAGCPFHEVPALFESVLSSGELRPLGLMTMAPLFQDQDDARPVFGRLRELSETLRAQTGSSLPILSMGMSNDFEAAIREGATHVRIGRAIFGG